MIEIKKLVEKYIYWPEIENKYQNNIDISSIKVKDIIPILEENLRTERITVVDDIIKFYSLNEILAKIRQEENEILNEKSIELYIAYTKEIEFLSKKIFSYVFLICLMETRHSTDFMSIDDIINENRRDYFYKNSSSDNKNKIKQELISNFELSKEKKLENYHYLLSTKDNYSNYQKEKFNNFYKMIEHFSNFKNYDTKKIEEKIFPILINDCGNLTVDEILKFTQLMFEVNNFNSGYGGKAWLEISKHASKFVEGKVNAEVFIDQSFSLEHNNGNIFNKNIIFKEDSYSYWKGYDILTFKNINHVRFENVKFCLNAQHKGQLLSVLKLDEKIYDEIQKRDTVSDIYIEDFFSKLLKDNPLCKDEMRKFKNLKLINKSVSLDDFIKIKINVLHATRNIYKIFGNFITRNKNFYNFINQFNVSKPELNIINILENSLRESTLSEKSKPFYKIVDNMLMDTKFVKNTKNNNIENKCEYLNTKEINNEQLNKELLGNKAFGLVEMQKINLPIPEALVFTSNNSSSYFNNKKKWLNKLNDELISIANFFKNDNGEPVACSVRSGSSISMPGMMDTILNVGIDDSNYNYFYKKMGKVVVNKSIIKFMGLFCKSLLNEEINFYDEINKALFQFKNILKKHNIEYNKDNMFPLKAEEQYRWCLESVFSSWNSERAKAYREHQGISHDIGTAAIMQKMVFGNLNDNSCTGVVFSRDCISGEKGVIGEFLINAQGEDVVSGAVTPKNIKEMKNLFPKAYKELIKICEKLEEENNEIQDIEFTVEDGNLYILQKRKAVCSTIAQLKLNQELFESGKITEEKLFESIEIKNLMPKNVVEIDDSKEKIKGLIGNPGVISGIVIRCEKDIIKFKELYDMHKQDKNFGWIFYAHETNPNHAPLMIKSDAFITSNGGFTSHAAILARSWNKPCVVGMNNSENVLFNAGSIITIDANNGFIYEGLLNIKENNKEETNQVINDILKYYKINVKEIQNYENIKKDEINEELTWMEKLLNENNILINNKVYKNEKFLDIGKKIALMILKERELSKKRIFNM